MKKLMEQWPYEFWPLEALGGLLTVGMLIYAVLIIARTIDDGIIKAGYEHRVHDHQGLEQQPKD